MDHPLVSQKHTEIEKLAASEHMKRLRAKDSSGDFMLLDGHACVLLKGNCPLFVVIRKEKTVYLIIME